MGRRRSNKRRFVASDRVKDSSNKLGTRCCIKDLEPNYTVLPTDSSLMGSVKEGTHKILGYSQSPEDSGAGRQTKLDAIMSLTSIEHMDWRGTCTFLHESHIRRNPHILSTTKCRRSISSPASIMSSNSMFTLSLFTRSNQHMKWDHQHIIHGNTVCLKPVTPISSLFVFGHPCDSSISPKSVGLRN